MGNSVQKHEDLKIIQQHWQFRGNQKRGGKIIQNFQKNIEAEEYIIDLDPKLNLDQQFKIYSYRKHKKSSVIKVYGAQLMAKQNKIMCGNFRSLKVITQRIYRLWAQMPQLTQSQCYYALNEALQGYKQCYDIFGEFKVNEKMIGINSEGQLKVWINQNYAQNHPVDETPFLQTISPDRNCIFEFDTNTDEKKLVENIIQVIQSKCKEGKFPEQLKKKLNKQCSFEKTKRALKDHILKYNLKVINKIHLDPTKCYSRPYNPYQDKLDYEPIQIKQPQYYSVIPPPLAISQYKSNNYIFEEGSPHILTSRLDYNIRSQDRLSNDFSNYNSHLNVTYGKDKVNFKNPNITFNYQNSPYLRQKY